MTNVQIAITEQKVSNAADELRWLLISISRAHQDLGAHDDHAAKSLRTTMVRMGYEVRDLANRLTEIMAGNILKDHRFQRKLGHMPDYNLCRQIEMIYKSTDTLRLQMFECEMALEEMTEAQIYHVVEFALDVETMAEYYTAMTVKS